MILKMTNKDVNFYLYMGKFFGSRIVQTETKDRLYDDNNKVWYVYFDSNNKVCAFIAVCDNIIKNVYATNTDYLTDLFLEVKNNISIEPSIVTILYKDIYVNCGFKVESLDKYKHFIMIRRKE